MAKREVFRGTIPSVPTWDESLDDLIGGPYEGQLAAFDRFTNLIAQTLERWRAYEIRDCWEDVAQNVVITLVTRPPESRNPGAIVSYVRVVTWRSFLNEINRLHGRRRHADRDRPESGKAWRHNVGYEDETNPADLSTRAREALEGGLLKALELLSERQRRVIEARFYRGLSNDEGAVYCNESVATYRRLLEGAIEVLSEFLERPPRTN